MIVTMMMKIMNFSKNLTLNSNFFIVLNYNMNKHNDNINLLEQLIISIAYKKHDERIPRHCKENDYKTVCVSLDEIKTECINYNIKYADIEYLFYYPLIP